MSPGRSMSSTTFVAVGLLGLSAALLPAPTVAAAAGTELRERRSPASQELEARLAR